MSDPRIPRHARNPRGIAHKNYTAACPNCGIPPQKGDRVVRIGGNGAPKKWWHEVCREAYLSSMRKQRMKEP